MKTDPSFVEFIVDQLREWKAVNCVRMFGGHAVYADGLCFGVLHEGRLYFKVDEETRGEFEKYGMQAFRPSAKQTLSSYYEVPVEVLEDRDTVIEWAKRALRCQAKSGAREKTESSRTPIAKFESDSRPPDRKKPIPRKRRSGRNRGTE